MRYTIPQSGGYANATKEINIPPLDCAMVDYALPTLRERVLTSIDIYR